ncbi:MAG TPA: CpXC domain-containing protein [Kofleriaceae bacterium]|jgi:hypothetical protein|nr:CpXC domain-containing protein [Kofleriaceae bacterium]
MSQLEPEIITCPACGLTGEHLVFRSLNGERVPVQVEHLLADTFEQIACECGHAYRPEHRMLYTHYALRTWIVMHPPADRARFAEIEQGVLQVFERDFSAAPPPVAAGLRGVRPRLVFGQRALSEAVRLSEAGIDPVVLECAKLLVFRRNLAVAVGGAPAELLYEGSSTTGTGTAGSAATVGTAGGEGSAAPGLQFGVVELASGTRRATITASREVLDEVAATRGEFAARYPALFAQPYLSATRYLFGAG